MAEVVLRTEALCRHFGGLAAVNGVALSCEIGRLHAVIGPNGAGKTTLINLLSGALALAELSERADTVAAELSHGERRQLEVAMTLAIRPTILLLDEPLAGMGAEESARMVALLRKLAPAHAILLVEHDMDAVFALADTLTVMVDGAVLASGAPAEIRANAQVQEAYLGSSDA